ncbi:Glycosyl transferase family 2 [Paenibacillus sp. UNCCL117]|uniref:glycosyltransferase n=1 Tax=unclassified Paenibacillus TaxID=185978 RepID=UPI0008856CA7|nr:MULTISPECIES: glycosyltransferase family 2 protein [unclassified Paenibacillus]SDE46938.1 Glycosyl transferase family 2 [Paenibacillus sp. cl123]SFW65769.1 Glycosyl transferase family 2 [Paenibacillus sp. UNCCL117]
MLETWLKRLGRRQTKPAPSSTSPAVLTPSPPEAPLLRTKRKARLTLSMVVKNESGRYLQHALAKHRDYIDDAVIIDDGSTDDTADECLRLLDGLPVRLIRNKVSKFSNEVMLRQQQWEETLSVKPDWILNLDADEWFEDRFAGEVDSLLEQQEFSLYSFRLFDFWTATAYRDDACWQAHNYYRPFLLKYTPDFTYEWKETPQHCGRYPYNIFQLPNSISPLRLKHMGWIDEQNRLDKLRRYLALDPKMQYGSKEQYLSIVDPNPHLVEWVE